MESAGHVGVHYNIIVCVFDGFLMILISVQKINSYYELSLSVSTVCGRTAAGSAWNELLALLVSR